MEDIQDKKQALQVLNLPEDADRARVDEAYRALMGRFSEENYLGSPLWDMAAEKRESLHRAYALLTPQAPEPPASQASASEDSVSVRVRNLLNSNELEEAEAVLNRQSDQDSNPEWVYLRGMLCWKRGWLDEAFKHVKQATKMMPQNAEYQAALGRICSGPPRLTQRKQAKRSNGEKLCGGCGACTAECLCEALCESLCECLS